MPNRRAIDEGTPDDTEGNTLKTGHVETGEAQTDDTEGNSVRTGHLETGDAQADDTEGNRFHGIVDPGADPEAS